MEVPAWIGETTYRLLAPGFRFIIFAQSCHDNVPETEIMTGVENQAERSKMLHLTILL
ncbi:MAG: hypothetical protein ACK4M9_01995 [Anaerobacillus sp.]|uniref:hypothetical protein n=1 Tax=Anaerobacillus sp. TaxID=1872506 RepID=UPI00391C4B57